MIEQGLRTGAEVIPDLMALYMSMPCSPPGGISAADAAARVGNCVKSMEIGWGGFPAYHGKLARYSTSDDEVLVANMGGCPCCEQFVWTGTIVEYLAYWEID